MRANTLNIQQGEQEAREAGEGRKKTVEQTLGDLWKGEGCGEVHRVNKMDTPGTIRKERRPFHASTTP